MPGAGASGPYDVIRLVGGPYDGLEFDVVTGAPWISTRAPLPTGFALPRHLPGAVPVDPFTHVARYQRSEIVAGDGRRLYFFEGVVAREWSLRCPENP
jgi:hypothetical protein